MRELQNQNTDFTACCCLAPDNKVPRSHSLTPGPAPMPWGGESEAKGKTPGL